MHVNRCTSDRTDKGGKSSNTSLKVESCLRGTTAARPEQSYLAQSGPSEEFLQHWHCDKGTHLIPVIVSDAVGNATDKMDFQHLSSATMPLRLLEKKENKLAGRREVWHDNLQVTPSFFKVLFMGGKNTLPKFFFTIIDKYSHFKVTLLSFCACLKVPGAWKQHMHNQLENRNAWQSKSKWSVSNDESVGVKMHQYLKHTKCYARL